MISNMHRANEERRIQLGLEPLPRRWICPTCGKARRTAFCPDDGAEAPHQDDRHGINLDILRQLAMELGTRFASDFNAARTYEAKGLYTNGFGDICDGTKTAIRLFAKSAGTKEILDAVMWAIGIIEGHDQSQSTSIKNQK